MWTLGRVRRETAGPGNWSSVVWTADLSSSLNNAGNDVTTVAANITGAGNSITYKDATTVDIGTAGATNGITTKRSEERRVGKEGRARGSENAETKNNEGASGTVEDRDE